MGNDLILRAFKGKNFFFLLKSNSVSFHFRSGDKIEDICEEALVTGRPTVDNFATRIFQDLSKQ